MTIPQFPDVGMWVWPGGGTLKTGQQKLHETLRRKDVTVKIG